MWWCQVVELPTEDAVEADSNGATAPHAATAPSRLSLYLDGAHTEESMATCAAWFADAVARAGQPQRPNGAALETQRVLLFNCMQV